MPPFGWMVTYVLRVVVVRLFYNHSTVGRVVPKNCQIMEDASASAPRREDPRMIDKQAMRYPRGGRTESSDQLRRLRLSHRVCGRRVRVVWLGRPSGSNHRIRRLLVPSQAWLVHAPGLQEPSLRAGQLFAQCVGWPEDEPGVRVVPVTGFGTPEPEVIVPLEEWDTAPAYFVWWPQAIDEFLPYYHPETDVVVLERRD